MNIKKYIPNTLTCFNLISGCIACVMALQGDLKMAAFWVILAAIFDFSDGFAARLLHAYSPIGKELDSLADVVSFGVAPGMIVFGILGDACQALPLGINILFIIISVTTFLETIPVPGNIIFHSPLHGCFPQNIRSQLDLDTLIRNS